ncbi:MAG: hypothetical protein ACLFVU_01595 [Phycisphaerae bacterium]
MDWRQARPLIYFLILIGIWSVLATFYGAVPDQQPDPATGPAPEVAGPPWWFWGVLLAAVGLGLVGIGFGFRVLRRAMGRRAVRAWAAENNSSVETLRLATDEKPTEGGRPIAWKMKLIDEHGTARWAVAVVRGWFAGEVEVLYSPEARNAADSCSGGHSD